MLRLLCRVGLHGRRVSVVDDVEILSVSPLGISGRVLREHKECRRCQAHRDG